MKSSVGDMLAFSQLKLKSIKQVFSGSTKNWLWLALLKLFSFDTFCVFGHLLKVYLIRCLLGWESLAKNWLYKVYQNKVDWTGNCWGNLNNVDFACRQWWIDSQMKNVQEKGEWMSNLTLCLIFNRFLKTFFTFRFHFCKNALIFAARLLITLISKYLRLSVVKHHHIKSTNWRCFDVVISDNHLTFLFHKSYDKFWYN